MKTKRATYTLPVAFLADLKYVALRMGLTSSTLLCNLAAQPVSMLRETLIRYPDPINELSPEDSERLMGELHQLLGDVAVQAETELGEVASDGSDK